MNDKKVFEHSMAPYARFFSRMQLSCLAALVTGEEGAFFIEKGREIAKIIDAMPVSYLTDGQGEQAVIHLHYFLGGCDWYITEKDMDGGVQQAYGLASLNGWEPETGYISIEELTANGAELDLYWTPKTIAEVLAE